MNVGTGQLTVFIAVVRQKAFASKKRDVGAGDFAGIVMPGVDESLKSVRASRRYRATRRRILRERHGRGVEYVQLALLAAAGQAAAGKKHRAPGAQVGIAAVERREITDGIMAGQGEPVTRMRADMQLDIVFPQTARAARGADAGGERDICAV